MKIEERCSLKPNLDKKDIIIINPKSVAPSVGNPERELYATIPWFAKFFAYKYKIAASSFGIQKNPGSNKKIIIIVKKIQLKLLILAW